ncbi:MAG: glutamate--tRNA ligase [Candidatus Saccharibacteria bacterium]
MKPVRTRFAPSPTGYLHVGGIRTALFAWLLARQAGGAFVLRFEDTDKKREVEGSREHLIKSLLTLGLEYDEGPDIGGPFAPYTQSERLQSYQTWAQVLIDTGRAYADPYTSEEVQAFREQAQAEKKPFLYRNHRPENPPKWDGSTPLRFKSEPKDYRWEDAIMGESRAGAEAVDDFILIKSDGFPTYNFAHIIDDHEMEITHVIRGQEFISSMPNYLNLYEALEFEIPILAHAPHVLGPDGKKKLGKRDGAKDVLDYIRDGYLPEALVNFIASLGWNDGTEQEIFTREELIEKFSLERVQRSGARFDEDRLLWMNGHWIRSLNLDELYARTLVIPAKAGIQSVDSSRSDHISYWPKESENYPESYKKQVLGLIQERLKYFKEIPELTAFFFEDLPVNRELIDGNKQLKKFEHAELKGWLEQAKASLQESDFSAANLTERLNELLEATGQKPGVLFSLIRIATTQAPFSPSLAETLAVLGKDTALRRIDAQLAAL